MEKMNFDDESKLVVMYKTANELNKNCINSRIKNGYDCIAIATDLFPYKIIHEYINKSNIILNIGSILDKVGNTGNTGIIFDESVITVAEMETITAKAITKAVKKYINELSGGYEPIDDLEKDMNVYIAKKTPKYMYDKINILELEKNKYIYDMEEEDREI